MNHRDSNAKRGERTLTKKRAIIETTSFSLHIMAMIFMLCDHLWGTVISGNDWLTCIGRLTFPIYAFTTVEGYFHTKNLKKYVTRLLIFAVISEIPFNLAMGSSWFYPIHQNVLWSFLIAIGLIHWNESVKAKKLWMRILVAVATLAIAEIGGIITFVDYNNSGLFMVLTFYFFRGKKWWNYLGQALCMWYINIELLGGFGYEVELFGTTQFITRQGFALLALIPIWLYRGKQGYYNKAVKYAYYAFYPLHLLILGIIKLL
jgi:hypothetical protein